MTIRTTTTKRKWFFLFLSLYVRVTAARFLSILPAVSDYLSSVLAVCLCVLRFLYSSHRLTHPLSLCLHERCLPREEKRASSEWLSGRGYARETHTLKKGKCRIYQTFIEANELY